MHTGVEGQPALAAEGVIDRPEVYGSGARIVTTSLASKMEGVDVPGRVAEETMEPRPMSVADIAAGEDDLSDVAVSLREIQPVTI